ncbi:MAG: NAD(+)/NADH kinase [Actinomycetota bacterium]
MTRVGFVVHPGREPAVRAARELVAICTSGGHETVELEGPGSIGAADRRPAGTFSQGLGLVVSVGGDGTLLRAAYLVAERGVPMVGVKVGRMGFLTEVDPSDAPALLERAIEGTARVDERLAVIGEPADDGGFESQWALNEIMVEKQARHRLVRLAVEVDGTYVTTFSADGVIVATPTGSTAYSFSVHGPIVTPGVGCLLVTPVAPHMVFDRTLVLGSQQEVVLQVVGEVEGLLSADGRETIGLPVGTRVRIRAARTPCRLVRRDDAPTFLDRVRDKFDLPGDPNVGDGD